MSKSIRQIRAAAADKAFAELEEASDAMNEVRALIKHLEPAYAGAEDATATIAGSCASIPQNPPKNALDLAQCDARFTPQQNLALAHLLAGRSYTQTAELANIDRSTLYAWRKEPAFAERLAELSNEALETATMRTRDLLLRVTEQLNSQIERYGTLSHMIRILSSKRIWKVANVMPEIQGEGERDNAQATVRGNTENL